MAPNYQDGNLPLDIVSRDSAFPAYFVKEDATIAHFNPNDRRRPAKRVDPINENIRYPEVIVIGPNGDNLGKMSSRAANELAVSYGLDLFCVAPGANPPVCKILNYGKYRFEKQKSDRAQKKNSRSATLKEVQLHISIGAHDLATKAKHAIAFLADGDKVHIRVVLKGREMAHQEIGEELLKRFIALLEQGGPVIIEKAPSWEGKCYSCIVASKSKK